MQIERITLRPVTIADAAAMAELVAQLYSAEELSLLRGPRAGQLRLFRHMLEHELAATTRGRFLAVDAGGAPLGSASLRLYGDPYPGSMPPGLVVTAMRHVGLANTLRFYGYLLRGSLAAETPLRRGECYLYSVIVSEAARRRGVGYTMIEQLEAYARQAGMRAALLRVMDDNADARRLYARLGYSTRARSSPLAAWLGVPSELMHKDLG